MNPLLIEPPPAPVKVLSTGHPALDGALGCGGYPRGRVVELTGPSLPALVMLAQAAVDAARAERVLVVRPAERIALTLRAGLPLSEDICPAESALDLVELAARSGKFALIVVDNVAALGGDQIEPAPEGERDGSVDDIAQRSALARRMSHHMRRLLTVASRTETTVLYLNPTTTRPIPWYFGTIESERGAGGNALKYYASIRVDVRLSTVENEAKTDDIRVTRCKVVKNKLATPFVTVDL